MSMTTPRASHCHYLLCVTASAVGRNIYFIVVAWLMMKYTADPSAIAMLLAAGSCAEFLTTNLGGVVTDRYRPQLTCLVCDGLRILTMAAATAGMMWVTRSSRSSRPGCYMLYWTERISLRSRP